LIRLFQSLAFKIGSIIVLAEVFVLTLTGLLYVNNFSAEIDRRIAGQVQLPGKLMQAGLLKFDSIADTKTMRDLVGEELLSGLIVGTNRSVFYALNPDFLGKSIEDIEGIALAQFRQDITESSISQSGQKIISITPIFGSDKRTLRFYAYVEAGTTSAQTQKANLIQLFLAGSLVTIALTLIILYIAFNGIVFSRLRNLSGVLKQAEAGNLAVRINGAINSDEIGIVQRGVNSMIGRLQEFVTTLEQRVEERTRQLNIARQTAEQASNAKSVFLSNMSHELRTPLNMVIGYTSSMLNMPQMYKNQPLPDIFREDMQLIQDNGKYLLGLINDILDLSKIEAEKLTIDPQATNLNELFRGVIATSLGLVKSKPLQLIPDFPDNLPMAWGDPTRIRQILLNLMSNAIKFTETGSVTLWARPQDGKIAISVIDTGVGIPENALSTIFDRYEQIKNQVEGMQSGTGLGLDISQRLCHMHGSRLTVTSTVGKGSTFSFALTCATAEQIAVSRTPSPVRESSVKLLKREQVIVDDLRQIVVAEEDGETRKAIRQTLEGADYIVVDAFDTAQLGEVVLSLLPDLVIISATSDKVNVVNVIESLRNDDQIKNTPILVLGEKFRYPQLDKYGVAFVAKPLDLQSLLLSIQQLLAMKPSLSLENKS